MEVHRITKDKQRYLDRLLLADEQEDMIHRYLGRGDLFALTQGSKTLAVAVVTDEGAGVCELKNLAVEPAVQGQGYGRQMMEFLAHFYQSAFHTMLVGTGDSPSTLPFYHKCEFSESHRIPDFFIRHYHHPIVEEGVLLRDMVVLKRSLQGREGDS